jgi:hypothetical protein
VRSRPFRAWPPAGITTPTAKEKPVAVTGFSPSVTPPGTTGCTQPRYPAPHAATPNVGLGWRFTIRSGGGDRSTLTPYPPTTSAACSSSAPLVFKLAVAAPPRPVAGPALRYCPSMALRHSVAGSIPSDICAALPSMSGIAHHYHGAQHRSGTNGRQPAMFPKHLVDSFFRHATRALDWPVFV